MASTRADFVFGEYPLATGTSLGFGHQIGDVNTRLAFDGSKTAFIYVAAQAAHVAAQAAHAAAQFADGSF